MLRLPGLLHRWCWQNWSEHTTARLNTNQRAITSEHINNRITEHHLHGTTHNWLELCRLRYLQCGLLQTTHSRKLVNLLRTNTNTIEPMPAATCTYEFSTEQRNGTQSMHGSKRSNVNDWFTWLWRWLPLRLSKRQSLSTTTTTVLFRPTM